MYLYFETNTRVLHNIFNNNIETQWSSHTRFNEKINKGKLYCFRLHGSSERSLVIPSLKSLTYLLTAVLYEHAIYYHIGSIVSSFAYSSVSQLSYSIFFIIITSITF